MEESLTNWARGQFERQTTYRNQNRTWNLISAVLALSIAGAYWYGMKQDFAMVVLILLVATFVSSFLKGNLLPVFRLNLFDVYAADLVRIVDLSRQTLGMSTEFDDAVIDLVTQIDHDVTRMQDNLSASRTLQALIALRTYLRRFATAVRDPGGAAVAVGRKDGFLVKIMGDSLLMLAEHFHKYYGIEDQVKDLERSASGLSGIDERNLKMTARSARRFVEKWSHAPAPLNVSFLIVIGLAIIWLWPNYEMANLNTRFLMSGSLIIAVLVAMKDSLQEWMQSWINE